MWVVPTDTETLSWTLDEDGHLTVSILAANTTFPGGATSYDFGVAPEENTAAFEEPDVCKNVAGTQTQADIAQYAPYVFVRGNGNCVITICHRTNAVVNAYNKITVSLKAVDGQGKNDHSHHQGPIFDPATMENGDDWGDIIPSNPYDTDGYNWTPEGMAVFNNGCNVPGRGGETDVCPNIDGIQLTLPNGLVKDDSGNCVTDQCPLVPGVQTDTTLCPAGGQGGGQVQGDNTTKPQTLGTSTELPAALPSTGGEQNPMLILLASLMAYGIAYLFQGRRQLNQNRA